MRVWMTSAFVTGNGNYDIRGLYIYIEVTNTHISKHTGKKISLQDLKADFDLLIITINFWLFPSSVPDRKFLHFPHD